MIEKNQVMRRAAISAGPCYDHFGTRCSCPIGSNPSAVQRIEIGVRKLA